MNEIKVWSFPWGGLKGRHEIDLISHSLNSSINRRTPCNLSLNPFPERPDSSVLPYSLAQWWTNMSETDYLSIVSPVPLIDCWCLLAL